VTGANCHNRRFAGRADSVDGIVEWSVRGWTDHQGTQVPAALADNQWLITLTFHSASEHKNVIQMVSAV
jgi:hypothetical protein